MEDTIAAVATAYGEGGIGIIRISGDNASDILNKVFKPASGNSLKSRMLTYGNVVDPSTGEIIDEAMAVFMKGPGTYTTEDTAEIDCHGSVISLQKTLRIVLQNGARMAEPGEFTKRAFLGGRLDLSQAEAVIDMIKAKTDKSYDVALSQLEGKLSEKVKTIRNQILDVLVDVTVNIDYPDEDIEYITYEKLEKNTSQIGDMIEKLISTASTGRLIREGIKVAIIGKPNVGKSSLMNELLGESRTIVTDIPGTTRDTIEEAVSIRGIPVYLIDTAGIRSTDNVVEKIGIERSKKAFNEADFIIFIVDGSSDLTEEDIEIINTLGSRKCLLLLNKDDLGIKVDEEYLRKELPGAFVVRTSLKNGEGVEVIKDHIESLVYGGEISQSESVMVTNERHMELLTKSLESINDALDMIRAGEALEIIEVDINDAYSQLGEIVGETVSDDVLNEVFSRFCLGK